MRKADDIPLACVIPKFNGGRWFLEALSSLQHQELGFAEIVISDDNSTDGSLLSKDAFPEWTNTRVVLPAKRLSGMGENIAFATEHLTVRHGYTLIASVDDLWRPIFTRKLADVLKKERGRDYQCIYSDRWIINEFDRILGVSGSLKHPLRSSKKDWPYFATQCRFIIHGALFKTELLIELLPLLKRSGQSADWILIAEAARRGSLRYLPEPLFQYRVHSNSTTALRSDRHTLALREYFDFLSKHSASPAEILLIRDVERTLSQNPNRMNQTGVAKFLDSVKAKIQVLAVAARVHRTLRTFF